METNQEPKNEMIIETNQAAIINNELKINEGLELERNKEKLKQLEEEMNKKDGKKKKKKLNFWQRWFSDKRLNKPNLVAVLFLRNNGNAETLVIPTIRSFFSINGKTYHERRDCTYTVTKERKPLAIIREWDMMPIGTKNWDELEMRKKFSELQDQTLRGIRHAELVKMGDKESKKFNTKTAVMIIIGLIIAGAIFWGSMGGG